MKTALLSLALVVTASAQVPCPLVKSPTLRGLHLGMTLREVQKVYQSVSIDPSTDSGKFAVIRDPAPDVTSILLDFSKADTVDTIRVGYTDSVVWDSVTDFTDQISPYLGVPKRSWHCLYGLVCTNPMTTQVLNCKGFEGSAHILVGRPSLELSTRRSVPGENKKRNFRP